MDEPLTLTKPPPGAAPQAAPSAARATAERPAATSSVAATGAASSVPMRSALALLDWPTRLLLAASGLSMLAALYAIFVWAPTERVMGHVQRIFYVHVPLAWLSYAAFFVVFMCSIVYLWRRDERWDAVARASAEIGVLFTTLFIVSGALWGRPVWGTWWTWDARLTTAAILWFIYVAYLMLRAYVPEVPRAARYAAVLGIVGFLDVPIIHMSVTWWRTLHPEPTVVRPGEAAQLPPEMYATLILATVAFGLLYLALLLVRTRLEWAKDDVRYLQQQLSLRGD